MKHYDKIFELFLEHVQISLYAVLLAAVIGVPIGIYVAKKGLIKQIVLSIVNAIYTIPSLALFTIMIPVLGIGVTPSMIALATDGALAWIEHRLLLWTGDGHSVKGGA